MKLQMVPMTFIRSIVQKLPKTENGAKQLQNSRKMYESFRQNSCVNILKSYVSNQKELEGSYHSFKNKVDLLVQSACSLKFLHNQHMIHNDIKPSNFLISSDIWVKLTDFGEAKFLEDQTEKGYTSPYVSPQRLRHQSTEYSSDIYSFGVMMYEVLTGKLPFSPRQQSRSQS